MKEYRRGTIDDAGRIAGFVRRFYEKAGGVYGIPYEHASCCATVYDLLSRGIVVLGEHSCAGAYLIQWPFNQAVIVASVLFWYFETPHEIAIFDQLWQACKKDGATHIEVAAIGPRVTGRRFYGVRNLHLAESHFVGLLQ